MAMLHSLIARIVDRESLFLSHHIQEVFCSCVVIVDRKSLFLCGHCRQIVFVLIVDR